MMNKWLIMMLLIGAVWGAAVQAKPYVGEALPPNELVIEAMNDVNDPSWFRGFVNRIRFMGHTQDGHKFNLYYSSENQKETDARIVTLIRLETGLWLMPYTKGGQKKYHIIQD